MDPLVSALNGSQTLVSQGLRTLELCVDNLQPDFLYEHIQPVRAQLMQVRCLCTCFKSYAYHNVLLRSRTRFCRQMSIKSVSLDINVRLF